MQATVIMQCITRDDWLSDLALANDGSQLGLLYGMSHFVTNSIIVSGSMQSEVQINIKLL